MTLAISSIELYQFRNYQHFSLSHLGKVTIFVGENAVGKTNLLEALHLLTACHSFRHSKVEQLVKEDVVVEQARAAISLTDNIRNLTVELLLSPGKRQFRLNGKGKKSAEIRGLAPSVVFTPDDLALIKGAHNGRRTALDALGEQLRPGYQSIRLDYEEVLRHKSKLLKDGASSEYLASINDMMVTCGAQLTFYRSALFDRLAPKIIARYRQLSSGKEKLGCVYVPSWVEHGNFSTEFKEVSSTETSDKILQDTNEPIESSPQSTYFPLKISRDYARDCMRRAIDNRWQDEIIRQRSIIGPHMDKVHFTLDGKDASDYASQGQQRSIVLAWKLAEVDLITELLGTNPILLLDDVMGELDANRRAALEQCIEGAAQAFITTTSLDYFNDSVLQKATVIHLPLTIQ